MRNRIAAILTIGFLAYAMLSFVLTQEAYASCHIVPELESPLSNSSITDTTPTLSIKNPLPNLAFGCMLESVDWQLATDVTFNNLIVNRTGLSSDFSYTVPNLQALEYGQKYYWRARLQVRTNAGQFEISNWTTAFAFTVELPQLDLPPIQFQCNWPPVFNDSPADGASVQTATPTLELGLGEFVIDPACQHVSTEWVISVSNPANQSGNLLIAYTTETFAQNLTSLAVPQGNLDNNVTYWWRARMRGPNGETSSWSAWTQFSVSFDAVVVINCNWQDIFNDSPGDGAVDLSLTPELAIRKGLGIVPICGHDSTDWQVATDANFNDIIYSSMEDDANLMSIILPPNRLNSSTTYYFRARLRNDNGDFGNWSQPTEFTTSGQQNGNGGQPPNEQPPNPPPNNAGDLCDLDQNQNGVLDDPEFFNAVDMWIGEAIDNPLFFGAVDAWIGQSAVCVAASSMSAHQHLVTPRLNAHGLSFTALERDVVSIRAEIFDLKGNSIYREQTSRGALRWNLRSADGVPVANGTYLYRVHIVNSTGQVMSSPIEKLIVIR